MTEEEIEIEKCEEEIFQIVNLLNNLNEND